MHVVVLGAGGLGCVIGARLAEIGADVTLIARPAHVEAIERDGLQVGGIRGDSIVRADAASGLRALTDAKAIDEPVDYLILLTKTRDTATALSSADALREHVGTALSLQNSVTKDDLLVEWIGDRAIGATTTEAGTIVGPGAVRHNATAPTSFYFGELDGTVSPRVTALAELFSSAGMGAQATPDIRQAEWEKLLQISIVSGFAASTLGYREPGAFAYGIAVRPGAEHYVAMAKELIAVYRAMGYEPRDFFAPFSQFRLLAASTFEAAVDATLALGTGMVESGILGRPSLHEDVVRGRPTEVDDSLGAYLAEADRRGIAAPTARGAYRVIKALEELAVSEEA
jgi:2-dehydropantoate 2-reductase